MAEKRTTLITNRMIVNAKDICKDPSVDPTKGVDMPDGITLNLADNISEVRGFGRPVTPRFAKQMIDYYCENSNHAWSFIERIKKSLPTDLSTTEQQGFDFLLQSLDPKNHMVSGVFGKEIIMQLLAQKNCEGIRYMFGTYEQQSTVLLHAVSECEPNEQGVAQSEPIIPKGNPTFFQKVNDTSEPLPTDPPIPEVHGSSFSRANLLDMWNQENTRKIAGENENKFSDIVLGKY